MFPHSNYSLCPPAGLGKWWSTSWTQHHGTEHFHPEGPKAHRLCASDQSPVQPALYFLQKGSVIALHNCICWIPCQCWCFCQLQAAFSHTHTHTHTDTQTHRQTDRQTDRQRFLAFIERWSLKRMWKIEKDDLLRLFLFLLPPGLCSPAPEEGLSQQWCQRFYWFKHLLWGWFQQYRGGQQSR